ncbi:hypothetical protein [Ureaplasma diversum]|uniref:Lipoprotein n=1 Tax=Ureaplasma diversum NCTC 246 TaxID=1188241 RepID=A0A084EY25_9BACT|nr:hypothetical protein [Ureaplasma diversum]KEZ22867.1 Hypothetical protein, predicted lipoprotein [Ureaplasma diversum NCTC 246]
MKLKNLNKKKLLISITSIGAISTIFAPLVFACTSAKDKNTANSSNKDSQSISQLFTIANPKSDIDLLKSMFNYNNNYQQNPQTASQYLSSKTNYEARVEDQRNKFYNNLFLSSASQYTNLNRSLSIEDIEFVEWINKLTPNTLKNDFIAFLASLYGPALVVNLEFDASFPTVEVYKKENDQKILINPNQPIFEPLTQEDINNGIDWQTKNKNKFVNINFWYAYTNKNDSSRLANDPFTLAPIGILTNTSQKFLVQIKDQPINLDLFVTNRLKEAADNTTRKQLKHTYRLKYSFNEFKVYTQTSVLKEENKQQEEDAYLHFSGDNNFIFLNKSYSLNNEITNASYRNDFYSLEPVLVEQLKLLTSEQIKKDVEQRFNYFNAIAKQATKASYAILNGIVNDLTIKELLTKNSEIIKQLVGSIIKNETIVEIVRLFTANNSLGAVVEAFKPLLEKTLDLVPSLDDSIKQTISSRILSIDFKDNLVAEIDQIRQLLNSVSIEAVQPYKALIDPLLNTIQTLEAQSKKGVVGQVGILDFIDALITLLFNFNESNTPNIEIALGSNKVKLYDLIQQIKTIFNLLVPHNNRANVDNDQLASSVGFEYKLSNIKIIDLISLNKDSKLDYKQGLTLLLDFLKTNNIVIPQTYLSLIEELLLNNKNWNKTNIKALINALIHPTIKSSNSELKMNNLLDFLEQGIEIKETKPLQVEYDPKTRMLNKLETEVVYSLKASITIDLRPLFDLLPEEAPKSLSVPSTAWNILKKEIPKEIILAENDSVTRISKIVQPQQLAPLIYNDIASDLADKGKHKLGYKLFVQHEVKPNMPLSVQAMLDRFKNNSTTTIIPKKYLSQVLGWLFYRSWKFTTPLNIFDSLDQNNKQVLKDNVDDKLVDYQDNVYKKDLSFSINKELLKTNPDLLNQILTKIKSVKKAEHKLEADALGREEKIYQIEDQFEIELKTLVDAGLIKFGSKVDINNDLIASFIPISIGFNPNVKKDDQNPDSNLVEYELLIIKKGLVNLYFKKPLLDLSNPKKPVMREFVQLVI